MILNQLGGNTNVIEVRDVKERGGDGFVLNIFLLSRRHLLSSPPFPSLDRRTPSSPTFISTTATTVYFCSWPRHHFSSTGPHRRGRRGKICHFGMPLTSTADDVNIVLSVLTFSPVI
jgi:hypothetical protein